MSEWKEFSSSESPCLPNANGTNFAILNHQTPASLTNPTHFREQMSFQDFQDGHHSGHLGYWKGTNLAILNLQVTQCLLAQSDLPSGANMVWRFQVATVAAILDIKTECISHSKSLRCSDTSHQVSAQTDLRFGRRCGLKIFKMADMETISDIGMKWF